MALQSSKQAVRVVPAGGSLQGRNRGLLAQIEQVAGHVVPAMGGMQATLHCAE